MKCRLAPVVRLREAGERQRPATNPRRIGKELTDTSWRYIVTIYGANIGHLGRARADRPRPRSGYDIKRIVDRTIRHFWAASYGQIYPELKRLEEAGWIAGDDVAAAGARAAIYRITHAGAAGARGLAHGRETRIELRDESLLRLFFADTLPREQALGLLAARREGYRQMLEYLRGLDDGTGPRPAVRRPRLPVGRSTTASGESTGATGRSGACAGPA